MADTLNDFMAEFEAERLAKAAKELEAYDSPEQVAAREARRKEEHEKGVRLGWWDAEGNSLIAEADEEDEEDDDAEEEE